MIFLRKLWPVIMAGLGLLVIVLLGRQNGKLKQRLEDANGRATVKGRMLDATVNTRRDHGGVIDRMRDGRF